jgi:deoxyribose-phosphate aldolase
MNQRLDAAEIKSELSRIGKGLDRTAENLKKTFGCIDLTSLGTGDTREKIENICLKVNEFHEHFRGMPNVGAICVYPSLVHVVRSKLNVKNVCIASVGAGFPSSQTPGPVKDLECKLAVEEGASEIDIVISLGRFLEGDHAFVSEEIRRIRKIIQPAKLKVILETGLLPGPEDVYAASMICLEAGADFIKTSTGKEQPAASPEAIYIMSLAVKDHFERTGIRAGLKPAGGISTPEHALAYAGIVGHVLGEPWLVPSLFRIGASRLANNLLDEIFLLETGIRPDSSYF